jgi:broad specificity phosphatase PhoE
MPVNFVYMRHGPKAYNNGKAPEGMPDHDPHILKSKTSLIRAAGDKIIKKYGEPDKIVMSPYTRVRQTVKEMTSIMVDDEIGDAFNKCYIDTNISEYLGHQTGDIDVSGDTEHYARNENEEGKESLPQPGEHIDDLRERVRVHMGMMHLTHEKIDELMENDLEDSEIVIWVVTHGIVISNIYSILVEDEIISPPKKGNYYPTELDGFTIVVNKYGTSIRFNDYNRKGKLSPEDFEDVSVESPKIVRRRVRGSIYRLK